MKNLFISIVCFLAISSSALATNYAGLDTNKTDASGKKQGLWKEIINGVDWYGNYYNDFKNGTWVSFHSGTETIMISKLESYINGIKTGPYVETDRSGYITKSGNYVNDTLDGPSIVYINGSHAKSESNYNHGKLNGLRKLYNQENFKVQEEGSFINNQRDGLTKWYYNEGTVSIQYIYKNGQLEGKMKTFYRNGNINSEGTYKNNELEGDYFEYYENGKPKNVGKYLKGKKEGVWKEYDETGKTKQVKYKNDVVAK
jgi:antitoxin component YwqK of YwqJK toxin-antitoxin module